MNDQQPEILVCDDNGRRASDWAEAIGRIPQVAERFTVAHLEPEEFAKLFRALSRRKLAAAPDIAEHSTPTHQDGAFTETRQSERAEAEELARRLDTAAMVIVDFDLTPTTLKGIEGQTWIDQLSGRFGDGFAYLARCFSDVPFTVLVNQDFQDSTFDVTMRRFERSFADLDVTNGDISRPSLWTGQDSRPFRPWHWPRLIDAPAHRRAMVEHIRLDEPLLAQLGLDPEPILASFHDEQLEGLLSANEDRDAVRTKDMRSVALNSKFGLHSADAELEIPEDRLRKIAASALSHWLERIVLPANNVLIDAPHLAARRPGTVRGDATAGAWSRLADLAHPDEARGLIDDEQHEDAAQAGRRLAPFLSRPVWLWPVMPARSPRPQGGVRWVFAEDTSRFIDVEDATEILTSVPGPHKQRFVEWLERDEDEDVAGSEGVDSEGSARGLSIYYDPITRMFA